MIEADDLYKIVGLIVVIIFVVSIGAKMFSYQAKVIEGMTNSSTDKDTISSAVSSNTDKLSDTLLASKYRSNYEDTIINLEKAVSVGILSEVINNAETISSDPASSKALTAMSSINTMQTFRETLNQSMIILDKSK
jgi:hypothetical protein